MRNLKLLLAFCGGISLVACGGGGGKSTPSATNYIVSATVGEGGVVNSSTNTVSANSTTSFNFTANEGYRIKSVTGCGGALTNNLFTTAAITGNCSVTGVFELITFTVSVSASAGGSYLLPNAKVMSGQTSKVIAVPDTGFAVNTFSGCGAGTADYNSYTTAPMIADCSVAISFKKTVAVEGTAAEGAALANAEITAKCSDGSGFSSPIKTDSTGHFTGSLGEASFPCALKLTSQGKTYFSLVREAGTVNITPLTDLTLVIASGKNSADWYSSAGWKDVIPQIDAAQISIQARLSDMGYKVPAGEFKPLTKSFLIGDQWDMLLDEFRAGLDNSPDTKTYDALINTVKTRGVHGIPSPTGTDVLTAEVCFNSELFAEGNSYSMKQRLETTSDGNSTGWGFEQTLTYSNKKAVAENGLLVLTREFNGDLISFSPNSIPAVSNYVDKLLVDFEEKSVIQISSRGGSTLTIPEGGTYTNTTTYDGFGNKIVFTSAVGGEISTSYVENVLAVLSTNGIETWRNEQHDLIEDNRVFKGLTNIYRAGKMRRVCEFEVKRKTTRPDSLISENILYEYYLLGVGLNISSDVIESITWNGKEI